METNEDGIQSLNLKEKPKSEDLKNKDFFNDPFIEFTYHVKPSIPKTSKDESYNDNKLKAVIKESDENKGKVPQENKYTSHVFKSPLLYKREKDLSDPKDVIEELKKDDETSNLNQKLKIEESKEFNSSYFGSKYKSPSIAKPSESYLKSKQSDNYKNESIEYNIDNKTKFPPLTGNLCENMNRGKYYVRESQSNACNSSQKSRHSVIYPFKN